jgi:acetate kinase
MIVVVVNAGSSSVRISILECADGLRHVESFHGEGGATGSAPALSEVLARLNLRQAGVIAHRVVHGGDSLVQPRIVDETVEREIERLSVLAPLHNPAALAWIRACRDALGAGVPQVAVFDTAFFAALPAVARHYALPRAVVAPLHLRRYGFHGLAHRSMLRRWNAHRPSAAANARVISLQLGSGCSITATRDGIPLDTSMGFSPLEGLMMATRGGDLDPGLLLHLQRVLPIDVEDLQRMLYRESGLLGVSGASPDMRALLASDDPAAQLAVEMYCYRARKYVGAYLAVLGGADAVLFGGGVGENAPAVRERILEGMQWAGIRLDAAANHAARGIESRISAAAAGAAPGECAVWTIAVDEAILIAEDALHVIGHPMPTEPEHG